MTAWTLWEFIGLAAFIAPTLMLGGWILLATAKWPVDREAIDDKFPRGG